MKITGIILAGGKSSRMGEDKGLLPVGNKPMVQYVIEALKEVVSDIIIIANNKEYEKFGFPVYPDLIKDKGPVGGIYTGLYYSETENNICVSCDTPLVSKDYLIWLLDQCGEDQVTLPRYNEKIHPLMAVYKKGALSCFKENLEKEELKLRNVIQQLTSNVISIESGKVNFTEEIFSNINTKVELEKIKNESYS